VKTISVEYVRENVSNEYICIAEEMMSSAISFPVNGTIEKVYVNEGQKVSKGTLLAELNTHSLSNAYAAAKAQLDQAEDAMERLQMLYDNESLAEIKYIEIKTDLEKARSIEAIAKKNLDDSRLTAPFSGIIGKKAAEAGENVLPNQTVFTLLKIDQINVRIPVPEKETNWIHSSQTVTLFVSALGDEIFDGTVIEKGVVADRISHTYDIVIKVNEPEQKILPGMVVKVLINDNSKEIISVPVNCLQVAANGSKYVWKVIDSRAYRQTVRVGEFATGGVEIISGLNIGESIITENYHNLHQGMKIKIE